jgi:hypothetical protein
MLLLRSVTRSVSATSSEAPIDQGIAPSVSIRLPPHPANVPGAFYVEDGCCLACGVWEAEAPGLLEWLPEAKIPHCYVARQPETDTEFAQMMSAMQVNEVDCIRVHGCKPDWILRLRAAGLAAQIDPEEGPATR